MNIHRKYELRSIELHRSIINTLNENPVLWDIPLLNIQRWQANFIEPSKAYIEWEHILKSLTKEEIINILLTDNDESARLRSSTPFTGIITQEKRNEIFLKFEENNSQ